MEPSFFTKRIPEPSRTSLPQNAHFFGTYISGYRTPFFRCLWNSEYKGRDADWLKWVSIADVYYFLELGWSSEPRLPSPQSDCVRPVDARRYSKSTVKTPSTLPRTRSKFTSNDQNTAC